MTILHSARKVCMLCSALGMLGGFAPAVAQEKPDSAAVSAPVYFHPAAVWEVKSLQDPQSGAKICTIAAPFNNGFFIQMTAAQEGINSISINFRQDVFAAGTTANVGISAPGVLKSVLPAVAFKPELLAINFQGQGALFDAIKTAGVMDFSMGADNQFRFYLNGFALALPTLAQCMQSHASPRASVDIPVPVLDIPVMPVQPPAAVDMPAESIRPSMPQAVVSPALPTPTPALIIEEEVEVVDEVPAIPPETLPPLPPDAVRGPVLSSSPEPQFAPSVPVPSYSVDERAPKGPPNAVVRRRLSRPKL
ncbi:MAG: hypothetical protein LRY76_05005 [Alphaproteobacteria bacterium]|nr:hypothetical protein [Alphaproteobacteria bacterium]